MKEEKDKIDSNIEDENINKMVQSFKDDNPNMSEEELENNESHDFKKAITYS